MVAQAGSGGGSGGKQRSPSDREIWVIKSVLHGALTILHQSLHGAFPFTLGSRGGLPVSGSSGPCTPRYSSKRIHSVWQCNDYVSEEKDLSRPFCLCLGSLSIIQEWVGYKNMPWCHGPIPTREITRSKCIVTFLFSITFSKLTAKDSRIRKISITSYPDQVALLVQTMQHFAFSFFARPQQGRQS